MRKTITLLVLLVSAAHSHAYDIASYCRRVSDAIGGSYQIEEACRTQERQAQSELARTALPARIESYCSQVGQAIGGSYQIKLACAKQELESRGRLK